MDFTDNSSKSVSSEPSIWLKTLLEVVGYGGQWSAAVAAGLWWCSLFYGGSGRGWCCVGSGGFTRMSHLRLVLDESSESWSILVEVLYVLSWSSFSGGFGSKWSPQNKWWHQDLGSNYCSATGLGESSNTYWESVIAVVNLFNGERAFK